MVQGNRNSIPFIFGGPILFNNLVIKICWISHSTFLDYYGIGLNSHSALSLWIGYSTRPVIENFFYSILSLTWTSFLHCNFFIFFYNYFLISLQFLHLILHYFTVITLHLLHLHLIPSFLPYQPSRGSTLLTVIILFFPCFSNLCYIFQICVLQ